MARHTNIDKQAKALGHKVASMRPQVTMLRVKTLSTTILGVRGCNKYLAYILDHYDNFPTHLDEKMQQI